MSTPNGIAHSSPMKALVAILETNQFLSARLIQPDAHTREGEDNTQAHASSFPETSGLNSASPGVNFHEEEKKKKEEEKRCGLGAALKWNFSGEGGAAYRVDLVR